MRTHTLTQWLMPLTCMGVLISCRLPNHHLIHPHQVPQQVHTWAEEVDTGPLRLHLEWAKPPGTGPFPAVLVHPDGGSTAVKMRGVIWDLAGHGYLAVAVDYRRLLRGTYRRTLFPWREETEVTTALALLRAHPLVDANRLAALGFSQGGVFSLLIAARAADIKAVIAYYPVTDFTQWLAAQQSNPLRRLAFRVIRWHFRRQSGARSEAEYDAMLRHASPLYQTESLLAPVLLIHGDQDGVAAVAESRRLATHLAAQGREVELLVAETGVHVFNFKQPELALRAWQATLRWLERYVGAE
jgi:dipeptidyl aminopeptidase/acylaminoacyl peptidase